jgi:hypothetical protein
MQFDSLPAVMNGCLDVGFIGVERSNGTQKIELRGKRIYFGFMLETIVSLIQSKLPIYNNSIDLLGHFKH